MVKTETGLQQIKIMRTLSFILGFIPDYTWNETFILEFTRDKKWEKGREGWKRYHSNLGAFAQAFPSTWNIFHRFHKVDSSLAFRCQFNSHLLRKTYTNTPLPI